MTSVKCKFDWLKTKGLWGAKSPDNEKIVAMIAALNALKGQLKLYPKLSAIANEGGRGQQQGPEEEEQEKYF
jgi:hypothetical protein